MSVSTESRGRAPGKQKSSDEEINQRVTKLDMAVSWLQQWAGVCEAAERLYQAAPPESQRAAETGLHGVDEMHLVAFLMQPELRRQTYEMIRQTIAALQDQRSALVGEDSEFGFLGRATDGDVAIVANFVMLLSSLGARSRRQLGFFLESARHGDVGMLLMHTKGRANEALVLTRMLPEVVEIFDKAT